MTQLLKVKAGFTRGRTSTRVDNVTNAAEAVGLNERINHLANEVVDTAKSIIDAEKPATSSEADTFTTYYNSLGVIDAGKDFRRHSVARGTKIRVALIVPEGAAVSAELVEYGHGGSPGVYALTKAVLQHGGTTA